MGARRGGGQRDGGPNWLGPKPRKSRGPKGWGPRRAEGWRARNFALFFPSPAAHFRSFFLSLGVISWNFGGVLEGPDRHMCAFSPSGCRVKAPAACRPPGQGGPGRGVWDTAPHHTPYTPHTHHLQPPHTTPHHSTPHPTHDLGPSRSWLKSAGPESVGPKSVGPGSNKTAGLSRPGPKSAWA